MDKLVLFEVQLQFLGHDLYFVDLNLAYINQNLENPLQDENPNEDVEVVVPWLLCCFQDS